MILPTVAAAAVVVVVVMMRNYVAKNLNLEKNIYFCNHTFDMSATSMRASVDNMKVRVVSF